MVVPISSLLKITPNGVSTSSDMVYDALEANGIKIPYNLAGGVAQIVQQEYQNSNDPNKANKVFTPNEINQFVQQARAMSTAQDAQLAVSIAKERADQARPLKGEELKQKIAAWASDIANNDLRVPGAEKPIFTALQKQMTDYAKQHPNETWDALQKHGDKEIANPVIAKFKHELGRAQVRADWGRDIDKPAPPPKTIKEGGYEFADVMIRNEMLQLLEGINDKNGQPYMRQGVSLGDALQSFQREHPEVEFKRQVDGAERDGAIDVFESQGKRYPNDLPSYIKARERSEAFLAEHSSPAPQREPAPPVPPAAEQHQDGIAGALLREGAKRESAAAAGSPPPAAPPAAAPIPPAPVVAAAAAPVVAATGAGIWSDQTVAAPVPAAPQNPRNEPAPTPTSQNDVAPEPRTTDQKLGHFREAQSGPEFRNTGDVGTPIPITPIAVTPIEPPAPPAPATHTVQSGDNIWKIAEKALEAQGIANPTPQQIHKMTGEILEANKDTVGKDGLIHPGQELKMPPTIDERIAAAVPPPPPIPLPAELTAPPPQQPAPAPQHAEREEPAPGRLAAFARWLQTKISGLSTSVATTVAGIAHDLKDRQYLLAGDQGQDVPNGTMVSPMAIGVKSAEKGKVVGA